MVQAKVSVKCLAGDWEETVSEAEVKSWTEKATQYGYQIYILE